jgi:hypothetical protein
MHNSICPPMRFPDGSKYVLKERGPFVRHYIEFPNGRTLQLATRKALSRTCGAWQQISIVLAQCAAPVEAPSMSKKLESASI